MRIKDEIVSRMAHSDLQEQKMWEALKKITSDVTVHLSLITAQMKYYDIHDEKHSDKVIENIENLLGNDGITHLNLYELFLIYCSCYLHDSAMAMPTWEYNILKATEGTNSCYDNSLRVVIRNDLKPPQSLRELKEFIVANKSELYGDFESAKKFVFSTDNEDDLIIELAERVQDYEKFRNRFAKELTDAGNDITTYLELSDGIRCDFVRSTHHIRVASYINNLRNKFNGILAPASSDRFVRYLASICRAHGETEAEVATLGYDENGFTNSDRINIRFLTIMLRLGDIIHFSQDRAPISLYSEKRITNAESVKQWTMKFQDLDYYFRQVCDKTTIFFSSYCETPEIFYSLQDYVDCIDHELSCYYSFIHDMEFKNFSRVDNYRLNIAQRVNRDEISPNTKVFLPDRNMKFTLDQSKILSLLTGVQLYKDKYLCLRELYQNSLDACRCMFAHNQAHAVQENYFIEFGLKETILNGVTKKYLYCFDNGTGMTIDIVKNYLLRIGNSYYKSREFSEQNIYWHDSVHTTSQFGIGILSCFMVADKLEITTKYYGSNSKILSFVLYGPKEQFYYFETNKLDEELIGNHGTLIKLFLNDEVSEDITNSIPKKLYLNIRSDESYFKNDPDQIKIYKSFHKSLFYLVNRQIGLPEAEIPVYIRLNDNTLKPIVPWNTMFDFQNSHDITTEDIRILLKNIWFYENSDFYKSTIEHRNEMENYFLHIKTENIDLYTMVCFPQKGLLCDDIRVYRSNLFVWDSKKSVLVDGIVVVDGDDNKLSSALSYYARSYCLINYAGRIRPILSIDRNSIISYPNELIHEGRNLLNCLAVELAKCANAHIVKNSLATDSKEAITSLNIITYNFPTIADQIVCAISQTESGTIPLVDLANISGSNSIKCFLSQSEITLKKLNMIELDEISRLLILGKAQAASRISVEDADVRLLTDGYISILNPAEFIEYYKAVSLKTLVIRTDDWAGKYSEYDLVSQLWPIIPSRLFDNICSSSDTEVLIESRARKIPFFINSCSGIAHLDPVLINPKY